MKHEKKTKRKIREFAGTYEYYVKYRPSIPKEVIDIIVKHFKIKPTDRVLDVGCGTGQVALAMDGKCREIVCVDPDPEMLKWAKKATKNSRIKLTWINCKAEDLGEFKERLGTFRIATSSRAFHRMNQEQVLKNLDKLTDKNGGIALFGDRVIWKGNGKWQQALRRILQKYLKKETSIKIKPEERWENILACSVFKFIKTYDIAVVRNWDIESIIGYLLSTSFAAPYLLGDQLDRFKEETKNTLLSIKPKGEFQENAVWSIILGSKKPR